MADGSPFPGSPACTGIKGVAGRVLEKKVRVVTRVRPFLPRESQQCEEPPQSCISILKQDGQSEDLLTLKDPRIKHIDARSEYRLDACYDMPEDTRTIFTNEVVHILDPLFQGFNATVFAYGATGSGKTFTMQGTPEQPGVMPLAIHNLLERSRREEAKLVVSYLEVYMERCYDLLEPKAELQVLEDAAGDVQLPGLAQVPVTSAEDFEQAFSLGCSRRKTAATGLNEVSSRSHGVFIITVTSTSHGRHTVGKLHLIDLAGNEDNRRTGNDGERLAESSRINTSLFVLGKVITALHSGDKRIPYRDSKLTRLLQDALGGRSRALLIACLAPGPSTYKEAVYTLALASKSRQVVNRLTVPVKDTSDDDRLARLKAWQEEKGRTPKKSVLSPFATPRRSTPLPLADLETNKRSSLVSPGNSDTPPRMLGRTNTPLILTKRLADEDERQRLTSQRTPQALLNDIQTFSLADGNEEKKPLSSGQRASGVVEVEKEAGLGSEIASIASQGAGSEARTPLAELKIVSRNVKQVLERKYLHLLNSGTKEELMALQGIGEKRAVAILKQRECQTSDGEAFLSLEELTKIGLSRKQVDSIVRSCFVAQMADIDSSF